MVSRSTVRASARSRSGVLAAAVRAPGESAAHLDRVDVRQAPLRDVRARARERGEREQADDEMHARPRLLLQRLPLAEVREADLDGRGHVLPAGHLGGALLDSRDRAEAHTTGAAAKGSRSGGGGTETPRARLWRGVEESRKVRMEIVDLRLGRGGIIITESTCEARRFLKGRLCNIAIKP